MTVLYITDFHRTVKKSNNETLLLFICVYLCVCVFFFFSRLNAPWSCGTLQTPATTSVYNSSKYSQSKAHVHNQACSAKWEICNWFVNIHKTESSQLLFSNIAFQIHIYEPQTTSPRPSRANRFLPFLQLRRKWTWNLHVSKHICSLMYYWSFFSSGGKFYPVNKRSHCISLYTLFYMGCRWIIISVCSLCSCTV